MIANESQELSDVWQRVATWSPTQRITLARRILDSVDRPTPLQPVSGRGYTAEEVIALLALPQPAPSDTECRQILEEEMLRKHHG